MFRVCFVCTGNRCRSPIAESWLREVAAGVPLEVESVGLLDLGPAPTLPEVLDVSSRLGLDLSGHRARHITKTDIAAADLVIGLEQKHVATAVIEHKVPIEKAFTLIQLVRLIEEGPLPEIEDPEERARAVVAIAHERRRTGRFVAGEDLEDPFGGPHKGYVAMAERVRDLSQRLASALFGERLVRTT